MFESLYNRNYVNVYITGSNVYMLSSELAMLLFSFHDYMAKEGAFAVYMKTGGIPFVTAMNCTEKID